MNMNFKNIFFVAMSCISISLQASENQPKQNAHLIYTTMHTMGGSSIPAIVDLSTMRITYLSPTCPGCENCAGLRNPQPTQQNLVPTLAKPQVQQNTVATLATKPQAQRLVASSAFERSLRTSDKKK